MIITLPDADGDYPLDVTAKLSDASSRTSLKPETVVLDRIKPGLTSVQTSVPEKGINPWLSTGDRADYTVTVQESVWYADILKEDGYVQNLTAKNTQQTILQGSLSIERKEQGIYYPEILLEDIASNRAAFSKLPGHPYFVAPKTDTLYNSTPRGTSQDFRLFIDNTHPDASAIDRTGWADGADGVIADGKLPEQDRLIDEYVVRGNTVTIRGFAEAHQRLRLSYLKADKQQIVLGTVQVSGAGASGCRTVAKHTDAGGLTVKFGTHCPWEYSFSFPDNGASPQGIPQHWYLFQAQVIDLSGNTSPFSGSITIYHDT